MILAIGIGSNLGNRSENIYKAIDLLEQKGITLLNKSLIYQNKAWLTENAPVEHDIDFLNLVVTAETNYSPHQVLNILKQVEKECGQVDKKNWGPRIVDLDLIFYDQIIINESDFILPHKAMLERPFVLLPLLQIAPYWEHPISKQIIAEICREKSFKNDFINVIPSNIKLMAIANITHDSFSGDGLLASDPEVIMANIWQKFSSGAAVLDLGAQSTRLNAPIVGIVEEIKRFGTIVQTFKKYYNRSKIYPEISIDSFHPEVIQYCIENLQADIINDVNGLKDLRMLDLVKNSHRKLVIMHSLEAPVQTKMIDCRADIIAILLRFFEEKIEQCLAYGLKKEQIILDPGIGFGKYLHHSWEIIARVNELKTLGFPLLIGHSKKSFMKYLSNSDKRTYETLGISNCLMNKLDYNDYIRIHDVNKHCAILNAYNYI